MDIEQLLKAGTHFGHLTSRWNPKMRSHVFMERNGIHIIDLNQTQQYLEKAAEAAARFAKQGKRVMFAGTKKQAREILRKYAKECDSPYVVERWLGGTLTNFQTIRKSIRTMEDLTRMQEDGTMDQLKKKERLMKSRDLQKLDKVLSGISKMARLPGALFIVDINREHIAVKEAKKLGIPIIAMVDTNCDPDLVNFPIPANDDALKSIELVASVISQAVRDGSAVHEAEMAARKAADAKRAAENKATAEAKAAAKAAEKAAAKAAEKSAKAPKQAKAGAPTQKAPAQKAPAQKAPAQKAAPKKATTKKATATTKKAAPIADKPKAKPADTPAPAPAVAETKTSDA